MRLALLRHGGRRVLREGVSLLRLFMRKASPAQGGKLKCLLSGFLAILPLASAKAVLSQQFCSFSLSKQFAIYCSDNQMRFSISSAAEEIKTGVLSVLDQKDQWKGPIVINVRREDPTEPGRPASTLQMVELDQGFKIDLQIRIGQDPRDVHFQEQLVGAILLEFAYRNQPPLTGGAEYINPPNWMVQGIIQLLLKRAQQADGSQSDIFKSIIDTNRLMPLSKFLSQRDVDLDSASQALYQAYSLCLVTLLSQANNGPYHLAEFLRTLPNSHGDPMADLSKAFPDLGKSEQTIEKWWSLNIARLATLDRFRGLSLEETDKRLGETLKLRLAMANGSERDVELNDFKEWIKEKEAKSAMADLNGKLLELSTSAHPLLRGIVGDYQEVAGELTRGKTRGVRERLVKLEERRANVAKLMSDIEDTMNWFEATQMHVKSNAFDSFIKKSKQWEADNPPRTDAISRCLDAVEAELN